VYVSAKWPSENHAMPACQRPGTGKPLPATGRVESFGGENSVADIGHHQRPNAQCEILRPHLFGQLEFMHAIDNGMPGCRRAVLYCA